MPQEQHPLPPALVAALRVEVGLLRRAEHRRRFPLTVHCGVLAGRRSSAEVPWPMPGLYDAGLRLDLLDALAARHTEDHDASGEELALRVWVARPGRPEQHDDDLRWWGSARQATSARALPLAGFHVVTRYGWLDLETGAARTWRRLRL